MSGCFFKFYYASLFFFKPLPLGCGVAAADTILLQPVLSWTLSFVVPMALVSRLTQSIHLCFGLPLFLLPGGTISRVFLPTYSWSRLYVAKPPQSCFPAPLCYVLYFQSLPDVIVSHIVSHIQIWFSITCMLIFIIESQFM